MPGNYLAAYFRARFMIADPNSVQWLVLRVDYADGFVAYLNGREIVRRNLPGTVNQPVSYRASALDDRAGGQTEEIDLSEARKFLAPGTNVFAIQAHNRGLQDFDFILIPELLANFTRGPFIQNASTSSVQVIWKTIVPTSSTVEYGANDVFEAKVSDPTLTTNHAVTLSGLTPGTKYRYRVRSANAEREAVSPAAEFRTLKTAGSLSFVVLGDSGAGSAQQIQLARVIEQTQPDLVLHAGDVIYPSFMTPVADARCLSIYRSHMKSTPYYFSIGNHDLYSGPDPYLNAFHLPTNSVSMLEHEKAGTTPEHYYSFDHGDAHFTVLFVPYINQYKLTVDDAQYRWLVNDLASTTKPWKFVVFHVSMDTSSAHRFDDYNLNGQFDRLEIKEVVMPVLSRYGVQLVFSGHDHVYEKLNPTNGVHSIVTGGGGIGLYGFVELDRASSLFWSRHHCVKATVQGDTLESVALGVSGEEFDAMTIQRALPPAKNYFSAWHSPQVETSPADDGQGNINGQVFDLKGMAIPTLTGKFSNLGRAYVNNDATNLYVGFDRVMLYGNNNIFLFIESPRLSGVTDLKEIGNGIVDPQGQGADGLDFLANLSFSNFKPSLACILGDEMADRQLRNFARAGLALNIGQGVFKLNSNLDDVPGIRIQQFNLSPQIGGALGEEDANRIEVAIPLEQLGRLRPSDRIKIGAVVAGSEVDLRPEKQARKLDDGFLGARLIAGNAGERVLEGLEVILAGDLDHDGLDAEQELSHGTRPDEADSDGDGLLDGWEVIHQLDPLAGAKHDGAHGDPDDDGFTNESEQVAGTDPRDASSVLRIGFEDGAGRFRIWWSTVEGRTYHLQVSEDPMAGFVDLERPIVPLTVKSGQQSYEVDKSTLSGGRRYYRVRVAR